ncbi:TPA: C40 family peptidase [Candidatus Woesearchaeota archaeon]|nr:C40 family peptidase [Candidatus Woesearchaeota archaeon]
MTITALNVSELVAQNALKYVGFPSVHHSRFHTGQYYPENERLQRDNSVEEFLRKHAGLQWTQNYYTYLREVHTPDSAEIGLDCSLLIKLAVTDALTHLGIDTEVPRHVEEFYGWILTRFASTERPFDAGTLLFLHANTKRQPPDHIGLYVGNGEIIHAPGIDGTVVKRTGIDSFLRGSDLIAAKRLII